MASLAVPLIEGVAARVLTALSGQNPEHVKIANAIEIRLVDQDLLPRFVELQR